jgi:heme/copper-type cytochrome/quinol oxidase subunit 2
MDEMKLPLELLSAGLSIIIVIVIFIKVFQYKQKLDVLKEMDRRKDMLKLTKEDKEYIDLNLKEYSEKLVKVEGLTRLLFPIFITIGAILFLLFSFEETLIHLNVIVVAYIYLQIHRIHTRNYTKFLEELSK